MANKRNRGRRRSAQDQAAWPVAESETLVVPERTEIASVSPSPTPEPTGMRKGLKRFVDSAIDTVFQSIWGAVIVIVLAAAGGLWYYLKGLGHLWAYLDFSAGFATAAVLFFGISALLIFLKRRRGKTAERLRTAKFFSSERGWLDHAVNRDRAIAEHTKMLLAITVEITAIGKSLVNGTKKVKRIDGSTAKGREKARRLASDIAAKLGSHAVNLERNLDMLESMTDLLIESNAGYLNWLTPSTEQEKANLRVARQEYADMLEATGGAMASTRFFRDSQLGLMGTSQDLNTALNRMVDTSNRILASLQKGANHWREAIDLADEKLQD